MHSAMPLRRRRHMSRPPAPAQVSSGWRPVCWPGRSGLSLFRRGQGRGLRYPNLLQSARERVGVTTRAVDGDAEAIIDDDAHFAAPVSPVVSFVNELAVDLGRALV